MNPYLIIAGLLAMIAVGIGGERVGEHLADAKWEKRENTQLAAANAKIVALNKTARDQEAAHAAAVNLISTTYQGELNAARAETKRLSDAAHAGTFGLRVHATCAGSDGSGASQAAPGAGRRDGDAPGQLPVPALATLSGDDSAFLIDLTGEADEVAKQLSACQAVLVQDRK